MKQDIRRARRGSYPHRVLIRMIRERRIVTELTLRELAGQCDVSVGYLADLLNSRIPVPSRAILARLAEALGCDRKMMLTLAYRQRVQDYARKAAEEFGIPPPATIEDLIFALQEPLDDETPATQPADGVF